MTDAGTGAAVSGAAAGVVVAAGVGWMYTYSVVSAPDGKWGTPDSIDEAGEISDSRGWCYVTSRECTTLPVFAAMFFKQSLPWLYPKFRKRHGRAWGSISLHRGTR